MIFNETVYGLNPVILHNLYNIEAKLPTATPNQREEPSDVINVTGVLFPRRNVLTEFGFGTALTDIKTAIERNKSNQITLHIDSPGGSISGVHQLATYIKSLKKPVTAHVSGTAASAAYWLAAAADEIVVDPTATLGSIGVIGLFRKNNDIEIVSSNAPDKRPDASTDEGRKVIQTHLDSLESVFINSLTELRPALNKAAITGLKGGVRVGEDAIKTLLADSLAGQSTQAAAIDDGWAKAFSYANGLMNLRY